jgi:hypothetical protein
MIDDNEIKEHWCYSSVECIICGNEHKAVFYLESDEEEFPLLECDNCNNITEHEIIKDYETR